MRVCVCLRGCTRACALFFNRPTAANIFVFWFHRLYAPLFIILPHSNSQELKEQKETKTRKTKSTRTKGSQKNKKEIQKQENKTLEQSQYLFPLHFHSHLYFIIPERIFMLVKVNLNPGLVHFFLSSWCTALPALQPPPSAAAQPPWFLRHCFAWLYLKAQSFNG